VARQAPERVRGSGAACEWRRRERAQAAADGSGYRRASRWLVLAARATGEGVSGPRRQLGAAQEVRRRRGLAVAQACTGGAALVLGERQQALTCRREVGPGKRARKLSTWERRPE
jgi:hypothetical protein